MQKFGRAGDGCTESRRDRLVTQAHTEDRHRARAFPHDLHARAGVLGCARPRGQQHAVVRAALLGGDLVVANHGDVGTELREVLHEVEDEGVVVVDHEDPGAAHGAILRYRIHGRVAG